MSVFISLTNIIKLVWCKFLLNTQHDPYEKRREGGKEIRDDWSKGEREKERDKNENRYMFMLATSFLLISYLVSSSQSRYATAISMSSKQTT